MPICDNKLTCRDDYDCRSYPYKKDCPYRETEATKPGPLGSAVLPGCMAKGEKELKSLLLAVNKVTAQHRHGMVISKTYLDNLANRQLEYEESL